jgi:uncharacterized membrane protein YkgB
MSAPDLETPEGRDAYRRELMGVARRERVGGAVAVLAGALVVLGSAKGWVGLSSSTITVGYGIVALGWILFAYGIVKRSRHHRRRMSGS